jgi:L-lactate dehydrogenase complex protein LldF
VKIDLPRLLLDLRSDQVVAGASALFDRLAMQSFVQTMKSRRRYENAGKLASIGSNLLRGAEGGNIKLMPPPFAAWTESRDFPPFARKSFRELWRERKGRRRSIRG